MPRGGRREGAGAKLGSKWPATLEKTVAREMVRKAITENLGSLIKAQVANAQGLQYLVYRDKKTGKFERVVNLEDVDQDVNQVEVWQKDPSVQAFTDLLNRALDKPAEQEQAVAVSGELKITWQSPK